ncbi:hypothetical protein [Leisingera sp. NJS204]|uniref:hypothetical protein n=1 Tax=Leisingera sp. NJS204 TaxID=2508307 RepID=UPI0010124DA8|nr:hypothetical protein [Leisingera sp. NJS204]QAX31309.1 hypothetical protein ETW24_19065 [Leisingera sp. NJS204]
MTKRSQRQSGAAPAQSTATELQTAATKPTAAEQQAAAAAPANSADTKAPEATTAAPTPAPAPAPAPKPKPAAAENQKIEMLLHKDAWDDDGIRHKKGTVVPLSAKLARELNRSGKAERFDPLLQDGGL